jgi:hypothetical protein
VSFGVKLRVTRNLTGRLLHPGRQPGLGFTELCRSHGGGFVALLQLSQRLVQMAGNIILQRVDRGTQKGNLVVERLVDLQRSQESFSAGATCLGNRVTSG